MSEYADVLTLRTPEHTVRYSETAAKVHLAELLTCEAVTPEDGAGDRPPSDGPPGCTSSGKECDTTSTNGWNRKRLPPALCPDPVPHPRESQ